MKTKYNAGQKVYIEGEVVRIIVTKNRVEYLVKVVATDTNLSFDEEELIEAEEGETE